MSRFLRRTFTNFSSHFASVPGPSTLFPSAPSVARTLPSAVTRRRKLRPPRPRSSPSPLSDEAFHSSGTISKMLPLKMEREFQGYRLRGRFQGDEARARAGYIKAQAMWRSRIRGVAWNKRDFVDKVEEEMAKGRGEDYIPPSAREDEEEEAKELDLSPDEVAALADAQDLSPDDIASRAEQQEDADEDADLAEGQEDADEVAARAEEQEGPEEQDSAEQDEVVREKGPKIVAHRIYLPNIQIRLMRNHTPPGEAYDPYVATFRLPPSMTKTDLRSYLKAVYDLDVTFIRTDLHWGEVFRDPKTLRIKRRTGSVYNYKRAVVGLHEPFHYPDDVQELYAMGQAMGVGDKYAKAWQDQLDLVFRLGPNSSLRTKALTKIYKRTMRSGFMSSNAGNTIRAVMAKRKEREAEVYRVAKEIREERLQKALREVGKGQA